MRWRGAAADARAARSGGEGKQMADDAGRAFVLVVDRRRGILRRGRASRAFVLVVIMRGARYFGHGGRGGFAPELKGPCAGGASRRS